MDFDGSFGGHLRCEEMLLSALVTRHRTCMALKLGL
jgi:hypothetical protein